MNKSLKTYAIHLGLFLLTVFTTLIVGAEFATNKIWWDYGLGENPDYILSWSELGKGAAYSFAFLAFLTFHEFGHYFTAIYHKVKSSLPYYIPIFIPMVLNIGSLGAVIRLKSPPESTRKFFDIGIAGPLAGFLVSVLLLVYGFSTLPDPADHLLPINPEYETLYGGVPTEQQLNDFFIEKKGFDLMSEEEKNEFLTEEELAGLPAPLVRDSIGKSRYESMTYKIGNSLIFEFFKRVIPHDVSRVPNHFELIHYPWLFVGYITLFFTALNLLPMGQLDGGHIIYGMFGRKIAGYVSRVTVLGLILMGGTGILDFRSVMEDYQWLVIAVYAAFLVYLFRRILYRPSWKWAIAAAVGMLVVQSLTKALWIDLQPSFIWLLYAFLVARVVGLDHPPAWREHRVNRPRQILGWIAVVIFILCFSPNPIVVVTSIP